MQARIRFEFNKAELTDSARRILDEKVAVFRANPAMTIVLVGFADSTGTDAYNMALGDRRAEAAKAYLVKRGIAPNRIMTWSRGERQPANNESNAGAQADNRRAVFRLVIAPE
jgi:outer membrane protein OmpA-like peptidoglycan-associated protein